MNTNTTVTSVIPFNTNVPSETEVEQIKGKLAKLKAQKQSTRKKRVSLDDIQRQSVIADLKSGKNIKEIAQDLNVSIGAINIIKKAAGLVKAHKPKVVIETKTTETVVADSAAQVEVSTD